MCSESIFEIDVFGNKIWRNKKREIHRLDGPAIEFSNGDKHWQQDDKLHRLDGPAVDRANGEKHWYKNDIIYKNKDSFFESLTEKEKEMALFSEDFLNG